MAADPEAEAVAIGWLLGRPNEWYRVTDRLGDGDFLTRPGRAAAAVLYRDGHCTAQDVVERWDDPDDGAGDGAGPEGWTRTLIEWAREARTMQLYAINAVVDRLLSIALRRRAQLLASETINDAADARVADAELVSRVRERADLVDVSEGALEPGLNIEEFLAIRDPDTEWVIPGVLERSERMIVTARAGAGKSTFLRQVAFCAAAGVHPFPQGDRLLDVGAPARVLFIDIENRERSVRAAMLQMLNRSGLRHRRRLQPENLIVVARPGVIDITSTQGWRWLSGLFATHRPDVAILGPLYRMYNQGDPNAGMGGQDLARRASVAFDRLIERYGCGLVLEAHPPGDGTGTMKPWGSALWEWWPEFGLGLRDPRGPVESAAAEERGFTTVVERWKLRDRERLLPVTMAAGGQVFPWRTVQWSDTRAFDLWARDVRQIDAPAVRGELEQEGLL